MEVAGKITTNKVVIDSFSEDPIECIQGCLLACADDEERQPFDRADASAITRNAYHLGQRGFRRAYVDQHFFAERSVKLAVRRRNRANVPNFKSRVGSAELSGTFARPFDEGLGRINSDHPPFQ